ncbi:CHAT domain-containing protein, partial [Pelagibacteraceae bacterium]|nr:CHAT domain-containing protein [Pelagibacteraceae bacterium]
KDIKNDSKQNRALLVKILKDIKPGEYAELKIIRNNNEILIKAKLENSPSIKPIEIIWTRETEKYINFDLGLLTAIPENFVYQKYFDKDLKNKYSDQTISCVMKHYHSYTVGIKPYDKIISVNGIKYDKSIRGKARAGYNDVEILRGNKKIIKKIIGNPSANYTLNDKFMDCTPEYADMMCFDAHLDVYKGKPKTKPTRKEQYFINQKIFECTIKYNLPVIHFRRSSTNDYFLKPYLLKDLISFITFKKPEGELKNLERYNKLARESLAEYEKLFSLYPESKNEINTRIYETLSQNIRSSTLYAGNKGTSELVLSKKKKEVKVLTNDIDRVKNKIIYDYKSSSYKNLSSIQYLTNQAKFLINNSEEEFLYKYLIKAKKEILWDENNLKYLDDVYIDLATIYKKKLDTKSLAKNNKEHLEISEKYFDNLYVQAEYGSALMMYLLLFLNDVNYFNEDSINELKTKIILYISKVENFNESHKEELLKINKHHYLNAISASNTASLMYNTQVDGLANIEKALKYIDKSEYKEKYFGDRVQFVSQGLLLSSFTDDRDKFNLFQVNLKSLFAETGKNGKRIDSIIFVIPSLLNTYYTLGLYAEMTELINFINNKTDRKQLEKDFYGNSSLVITDYNYSKILQRNHKHQEAVNILENILKYTNISIENYKSSDTRLVNGLIIQNIFPALMESYEFIGNYDKIEQIAKLFFNADINSLNKKDYLNLYNYYRETPEIFAMISKNLLKIFQKRNNKKQFKNFSVFFEKKIFEIIENKTARKNSLVNDEIFYSYISEIALILLQEGDIKKGKKMFEYLHPKIIKSYNNQIFNSIWASDNNNKVLGSYYLEATEFFKNDLKFINQAYKIAQIGKNTSSTRDFVKSIVGRKYTGKKGDLINKYNKLQRQIKVTLRDETFKVSDNKSNISLDKSRSSKNMALYKESALLEDEISNNFPEYFNLLKIKYANIADIQSELTENDSLIDYFFSKKKMHIVHIEKNNIEIFSKNIESENIKRVSDSLYKSLIIDNNKLRPFDVNKSNELNKLVFLFLKGKLKNKIYVVPDGQLNRLPLHMLATHKGKSCIDCSSINFNLYDNYFSYLPTAETFININSYEKNYSSIKKVSDLSETFKKATKFSQNNKTLGQTFKNIKNYKKNKSKAKNKIDDNSKNSLVNGYIGIGDPDLYVKNNINSTDKKTKKISFIRGLSNGNNIKSSDIRQIYGPVKGSETEIKVVAEFLNSSNSEILLRENANEEIIKSKDLTKYNVIHFATHGEVSGVLSGYNEPFLVLTPPDIITDTNDGLLTMSEIMNLNTSADIVVLSACNTGSGDQNTSDGFSGLAKGFFMSGSKSILVSNWYVETFAAQKMIINYFKNIKSNKDKTLSENLNLTMIDFIKEEKDKSHPIFWAPFVLVGSDKKILLQ